MNPTLALIIGLVVGIAIGGLGVLALVRRASTDASTGELRVELSAAAARETALREQLDQQRQDRLAHEAQERQQNQVLQMLAPVREVLNTVQQKVNDLERDRAQQYGAIAQQLKQASTEGAQLRSTTEALASALRSNNTRGVWGETQLRSVVEAAGLLERVDFDTQASIAAESGARRPDLVVHLPGGKNIAVDAKVPFNAYLEASAIPPTATGADGARRAELLRDHVRAMRDHVTALSGKKYWTGLDNAPELTIAFIPSESLISSALEADPGLLDFAFSKRVALASPVTLWSVLKTVAFSWQQDVLTHEAKTLFDLSRELYSRLTKTAEHVEKLGRSLRTTITSYNGFVGSLERQVLPTARRIGALNEQQILARIEPVEESPRDLAAPELVAELERSAHGEDPAIATTELIDGRG